MREPEWLVGFELLNNRGAVCEAELQACHVAIACCLGRFLLLTLKLGTGSFGLFGFIEFFFLLRVLFLFFFSKIIKIV
jgi:hypothetical protein